jgi:hypothetical protein
VPRLEFFRRVKIGTFKVNAHGTRLGERFLKMAFDWAIEHGAPEIYVTTFPKHTGLINLLERYGFAPKAKKGAELVFVKTIGIAQDTPDKQYPAFKVRKGGHILSIYPKFHTSLFPDSFLKNEDQEDFQHDTSSSNAIQKIYICAMEGVKSFQAGDPIIIYRTAEPGKPAEYSSVATSVCVFKEYRNINSFTDESQFIEECAKYSVFSISELRDIWRKRKYAHVIYFTYNAAFPKKVIRKKIVENAGVSRDQYWGTISINEQQLRAIISLGELDEGLVID